MSLYSEYYKERMRAETIEHEFGFVIYSIAGDECFMREIYVDPSHRKESLGSALVSKMERIAKERGCKRVTATIFPDAIGASDALHAALRIGMKLSGAVQNCVLLMKEL